MTLEQKLVLGALSGIASDQASAFPILTVTAGDAGVELVTEPGDSLRLSPGRYLAEVSARALKGALSPVLRLSYSGGGSQDFPPTEIGEGVYRYAILAERAVDSASMRLRGSDAVIFVSARIETETLKENDAPTLQAALVSLGRAAFRKLPQSVRRAVLNSGRRANWLRRLRSDAPPPSVARSAGRFVATDDARSSGALRADFENRYAVARGLTYGSYRDDAPPSSPNGAAKLIAFHLPQFHTIPENDAWWGKGFTEWSNVAKSIPQFVGHYQPRLPGELGFYDLCTPGVLAQQAALARAYGISAFCFHYYWFAGKRLLEAPLDAFLADASIDIEFCLCWANENWTRRWDGDESEVLVAQSHTVDDHARVFADLARYMDDPRYLRVDGKPVLLVYRPAIIDNAREMTALWRQEAAKRGWPGIYLVATSAFRFDEPAALGFDALSEFPPHGFVSEPVGPRLSWLNTQHRGVVFDYEAVAREETQRMQNAVPARKYEIFPGVMPGWDNEARRPGAGTIYHGATPEAYGEWLDAAIHRAARTLPADRRFVFINAWNEWAEGAHLEPDRAFGRAFLAETARVLSAR